MGGHRVSRMMLGPRPAWARPACPCAARHAPQGAGASGAPGDVSPEEALSPSAAQRSFRPAMPAHLAPELSREAVIEEVFENQRLQVGGGWGAG